MGRKPESAPGETYYQQLREDIFSGRRLPGDVIKEKVTRKDKLQVSQATVRQALVRLEHEGLVVRRPRRDTTVVNLSKDDIHNLIGFRIPLELLACTDARRKLGERLVRGIAETHMRRIAESPRADEAFHHFIWELSDNPLIIRALKSMCTPMFAFAVLLRSKGLQRGDRVAAHRAFLDALIGKRAIALEGVVEDHVRGAYAPFFDSPYHNMLELARSEGPPADHTLPPAVAPPSKHREFLRWIPAIAVATDSQHRVVYANEAFERFIARPLEDLVGQRLQDPFWSAVHERVANDRWTVLVLTRQHGRVGIAFCFPMSTTQDAKMAGELAFDVTNLLEWLEAEAPAPVAFATAAKAVTIPSEVPIATEILSAFFQALPGIATWKDLQGRLLWTNPEYQLLTGKTLDQVLGQSPLENWGPLLGDQIIGHDARVRDAEAPLVTSDTFPFLADVRDRRPIYRDTRRIAIRFPVFNRNLELEGTASLGFDHELLEKSVRLLRRLKEGDLMRLRISREPSGRTSLAATRRRASRSQPTAGDDESTPRGER
jgi:GntR family transcriptional regulator, rspAB operon transcriptional repressor